MQLTQVCVTANVSRSFQQHLKWQIFSIWEKSRCHFVDFNEVFELILWKKYTRLNVLVKAEYFCVLKICLGRYLNVSPWRVVNNYAFCVSFSTELQRVAQMPTVLHAPSFIIYKNRFLTWILCKNVLNLCRVLQGWNNAEQCNKG